MSNAVLFFCYNRTPAQLALSKEALASIFAQDIPVEVIALDNGSTDETWEWLESVSQDHPNFACYRNIDNLSPVAESNRWLGEMFGRLNYQHVLALPNDVIVPPYLYREFLKWPRGIVTGSMTPDRSYDIYAPVEVAATSENTPLAAVLWRKWAYDALVAKDGYFFDERYQHYCSDCDWALRTASCGIRGVQLNVPYYHYVSASIHLNTPEIATAIQSGANADRQKFIDKWGFPVTSLEYGQRAVDINFRGSR